MVLGKLRAILRSKGFKLFTRPFELNIVGLRSESVIPNRFDDEIHVFYKVSALKWNYHVYKATTDPGTFWLKNPIQAQGTAILSEGQFRDAYALGLHREQYQALVQQKPVTILRDYDRDAKLDFLNGNKSTGFFGINIHRASSKGKTKLVDKYSAGCQVFENAKAFDEFLLLCKRHHKLYGNKFTYSLIDFRAVKRETFRRIALGAGIIGLIAAGYLTWMGSEKLKTIAEQISESFINIFKPNKNQ
ncbi:MAG: hypothetical protein ACT4ON_13210 [Bacteroidota bacterium]